MVALEQDKMRELYMILRRAEEFHGHLGPFLVLGVKMGLVGVRELGAREDPEKLRVTVISKYFVPFSCIIDGIQVATQCTIGNKKLRLRSSSSIAAKFELQNGGQVTVRVNPATFERLKNGLLAEESSPQKVRKLAEIVAPMPEEELFII